jgi:hypothetical protein
MNGAREPHPLSALFRQLGLEGSASAIENFIAAHRPLPGSKALTDAPFWNAAQREFFRQAINDDANWALSVDQLDARLR